MCNPSSASLEGFKALLEAVLCGNLVWLEDTWLGVGPASPTNATEAVMPSGISPREQDSSRAKLEPESGPITSPPTPLPVVNQEEGPLLSGLAGDWEIART